jgi:hypothetical protein
MSTSVSSDGAILRHTGEGSGHAVNIGPPDPVIEAPLTLLAGPA